jgi:hypothetical protein
MNLSSVSLTKVNPNFGLTKAADVAQELAEKSEKFTPIEHRTEADIIRTHSERITTLSAKHEGILGQSGLRNFVKRIKYRLQSLFSAIGLLRAPNALAAIPFHELPEPMRDVYSMFGGKLKTG